jgi:multicomponent Na+:H+ antiporter subunit A
VLTILFAVVLTPFVFACLLSVWGRKLGKALAYVALCVPVFLFGYFLLQIPGEINGQGPSVYLPWMDSLGLFVSMRLTALSALFALLICGVGILVFWYSIGYLSKKEKLVNFYVFLLIFMGSMLGVVVSNNLMLLYLFWEGTSFSSFLLIGFWYEQERPRYGAQKALFITVIGGFCMFAAFVMLYLITGSFEISEIMTKTALVKSSALYPVMVILVCLGAFTKSAQAPFHIWLPDAMEAPTPISCYLHSATMVKAGIYLLLLMTPVLGGSLLWFLLISSAGILSLLWGAYRAIKQYDLKAILANSTISQLGLVIALIGYGSEAAIAAACFHLLNHSAFKGTLFLVTGMVDHGCGTRDIRRLQGLAKVMPLTAVFAACGSLAMAGLPPFNGFLSKEMFFESSLAVINGNFSQLFGFAYLFPILAILGSIFTFVYCMIILFKVFLRGKLPADLPLSSPGHEAHGPVKEPAPIMLLPTGILASLTLLIAFFPNFISSRLLEPAVSGIVGKSIHLHIAFWHGFNLPLLMTVFVIVAGILLFLNSEKLRKAFLRMPKLLSANDIYDRLIPKNGLAHAGQKVIDTHMSGRLRNYVLFSSLFFVLLTLGTTLLYQGFAISFADLAPISVAEIIWSLAIVVSCIFICCSPFRILSIFAMGVIGYSVAFFFVLFRAPDLALTQLLVETVALVLFFLAFRFIPISFKEKKIKKSTRNMNLFVSALAGITMVLITVFAHSNKMFEPISAYYSENAKILGGGSNIVNVILVDFRGYDTMGEITVIVLAAVGVFSLISLAVDKKKRLEGENK